MTADLEITDVIIIGGSHAGLSAALTLYRACHTSLIFDAGAPRNAKADHVHMMPGFDKKTLNELREVARDELRATGLVRFVAQKVVTATKTPDGLFEVVDGTGKHWKGVEVDHRRLTRITEQSGGGIAVKFAKGPGDQLAFMAHSPDMPVDRTLPDQLGCECDIKTGIKVNPPFYTTTAPGVFAAGDCCAPLKSILMGMTAGSCAGVEIARELLARGA
ncbi:hypothetical protein KJ359_003681 [Pestalotiopsis sp. 9143b]|nr:hypothetical protein KJ359_003681 [Pestalotiopsis sp. 9143b]